MGGNKRGAGFVVHFGNSAEEGHEMQSRCCFLRRRNAVEQNKADRVSSLLQDGARSVALGGKPCQIRKNQDGAHLGTSLHDVLA